MVSILANIKKKIGFKEHSTENDAWGYFINFQGKFTHYQLNLTRMCHINQQIILTSEVDGHH